MRKSHSLISLRRRWRAFRANEFRGRSLLFSSLAVIALLGLALNLSTLSSKPSSAYKTRFTSLHQLCPTLVQDSHDLVADEIVRHALLAGEEHGVNPGLVLAVVAAESRCVPSARSGRGAVGLMQLMPATATWLGVSNPSSIQGNLLGGTKYLAYLLDRFEGNIELTLAAYNSGPTRVSALGKVPPYKETRDFVARVQEFYRLLQADPNAPWSSGEALSAETQEA